MFLYDSGVGGVVSDSSKPFWETLKEKGSTMLNSISNKIKDTGDVFSSKVVNTKDVVSNAVKTVSRKTVATVKATGRTIKKGLNAIPNLLKVVVVGLVAYAVIKVV